MDYNPVTDQSIIFGGSTTADLLYNDMGLQNHWMLVPSSRSNKKIAPSNTNLAPRIGSGGFVDSSSNFYLYLL